MLMTAQIRKDPRLLTLFLEAAQGALEGLAVLHPDAGQSIAPSQTSRRLENHDLAAWMRWWIRAAMDRMRSNMAQGVYGRPAIASSPPGFPNAFKQPEVLPLPGRPTSTP